MTTDQRTTYSRSHLCIAHDQLAGLINGPVGEFLLTPEEIEALFLILQKVETEQKRAAKSK